MPEPTSVTATVAPVESPIRFSVIPVPSLTVAIAVQAQDEVLGAARDVAAEIAPRADLHDREGSFSQENIDALWRAGIGSLSLPVSHGGPGANLRTTAAAVRTVAAGDASTALVWVMHLIYLQVLADDSFGLDPAVRTRVFCRGAGGARAHQRAARRARARHAGPWRRPRDPRRPDRGRLPDQRAQDLLHRQLRAEVDGRLGGDDRGRSRRSAQRAVPRAGRRARHHDRRDVGPPGDARLCEQRRRVRGHADPARPRRRPAPRGRVRLRAAHARTSWAG